jgi:hypothetical protein
MYKGEKVFLIKHEIMGILLKAAKNDKPQLMLV